MNSNNAPQRPSTTFTQEHQAAQPEASTSYAPHDRPQLRPANNVRPQRLLSSSSNASRAASGAPTTSNTQTSYASFPSQQSLRSSSLAPSQASGQPRMQPRAAPVPVTVAPEAIQGYQNITSLEPAPKRPLWSLGSTLPRVRRLRPNQPRLHILRRGLAPISSSSLR